MKSAMRVTTATFGAIAAIAGLEHGIGEVLQGNIAPAGLLIQSWPDAQFFRILGGEPAMTFAPSLRLAGVFTIALSVLFLLCATRFAGRKGCGLTLMLLSVLWLFAGGGFGPPLVGLIVGATAARAEARRVESWPERAGIARRTLAALWPWLLVAGVAAWLCLFPGASLLAIVLGLENAAFVAVAALSAFGLLLLTEAAGLGRDTLTRDRA
jgi:hypothetical protein